MAIGRTNVGGGGGGLNFSVKAYASESVLPNTASENTIAVITDTAITSWVLDVKEPESPVVGMVWIEVGTESAVAFNALKKNVLAAYPVWVRQYSDGAFADRYAFIYQNGAWVQFSEIVTEYVVFDGTNTADYVGGWSSDVSSGELSVAAGGSKGWIAGKNLCSNVAIDISQYSTMHIVVNNYNDVGTFGIGTTNANGSYDKSVSIASATEYTIDVSDIDGEYYVKLASTGKQNNTNYYVSIGFSVSKVWLE